MFPDPMLIRASLVLVGIGPRDRCRDHNAGDGTSGDDAGEDGRRSRLCMVGGLCGAFVSPIVGGALATSIGLRNVMLFFLVFQFLPICCMYLLPETGKGRTPQVQTATAAAG